MSTKFRQMSEPLGASEFAATLNGDNPTAILRVLKRFTKTVRRERRAALASDEDNNLAEDSDDDDGSSSDGEGDDDEGGGKTEDLQPPPAKKRKKAVSWKEDTNDYQVPFVGTAVSRGDIAEVVRGEWPTGLLRIYLTKSPMAIEMAGDDWIPSTTSSIHKSLLRRKQTELSRGIYKAYLKALSELVTAAIPVQKLREDLSGNDGSTEENETKLFEDQETQQHLHPFLSALLKKRLAGMLHLLVEETDKGRGKPGIYGGCGSLVPPALQFLRTVSRTSISNARLVCRYLDDELPDGVLKAILRPPPPPHTPKETSEDTKLKGRPSLSKSSRTEAIRLATVLLQTADSAVATYICTAGSRERKIKPGILYCAFREGLAKHAQADDPGEIYNGDDYFDCVAHMLEFAQKLLKNPLLSKVVGSKLLFDLFSHDTLCHLCDLSSRAPTLSTEGTFDQVLPGTDEPEDNCTEASSYAGIEARRLLFLLLGDLANSPLLGNYLSHNQINLLVKVMLRLLQTRNAGIQVRKFLLHCVETSPMLLPEILRVIIVPDSKKAFEFISTLRFVSNMMEKGPAATLCLQNALKSGTCDNDLTEIFASLWPIKLKRQALGKAMQNDNPLVVLECVKFIRSVLGRYHSLVTSMSDDTNTKLFLERLSTEFPQLLPDLQVILAVRSKYDLNSESKGTDLVCHSLHLVLQKYSKILPHQIQVSSFDWMKLLPEPGELLKASGLVQRSVMYCLSSIMQVCAGMPSNHINSLGSVLEIMLRTKDMVIHTKCREIASILLLPLVESRSTSEESDAYLKLEVSWWLDAVTLPTLSAFCTTVTHCAEDSLGVLGRVGKTLRTDIGTMQLPWSIIMIAALSEIEGDVASCQMIIQVATRSLLFQRNPIPFACFINGVMKSPDKNHLMSTPPFRTALVEYARSLVEFSQIPARERLDRLSNLLKGVFSQRHEFCKALGSFMSKISLGDSLYPTSFQAAMELARFSVHVCMISPGLDWIHKSCNDLVRRTIPSVLLAHEDQHGILSSQLIRDIQTAMGERSFSVLNAIILSHPRWGESRTPRAIKREQPISLPLENSNSPTLEHKDTRSFLLRLALLGRRPSSNEIVKTQLTLIKADQEKKLISSSVTVQVILNLESACDPTTTDCSHRFDFEVISQLFEFWWSTPRDAFSDADAQELLYCPFRTYFAKLLSSILITDTMEATFLLTLFTKKNEGFIIDRCLGLDHPTAHPHEIKANTRVLESILQSDPLRFGPYFLLKFQETGLRQSVIWSHGLLDGAVKKMVCHPAIRYMGTSSLSALGDAVFSRALTVLLDMNARQLVTILCQPQRDGTCTYITGTLDLANESLLSEIIVASVDELANAISRLLCSTMNHGRVVKGDALGFVCRLGMTLFKRMLMDSNLIRMPLVQLSSALFCSLLNMLLLYYKKFVYGGLNATQSLDCQEILDFLVSLLENEQEYDPRIVSGASDSLLHKVCRNGLKHGIHDGGEEMGRLAASSLKMVRLLSLRLSRAKTLSDHFVAIPPSELFGMLTSHSKFAVMASRKRTQDFEENDRVELVRLMHSCVELSPDQTVVEPALWGILYHAFGAGLDELDTSIRKFFYLCSTIKGKNISLPFFDEVRWFSCAKAQSKKERRWDWLLDALDANRIRETVACFPINDSFDLNIRTSDLKPTIRVDIDDNYGVSEDELGGSDDHQEGTGKEQDSPFQPRRAEGEFFKTIYTRRDENLRYSPAFVLPLVLGALHSYLAERDVDSMEEEGQEFEEQSTHFRRPKVSTGPLSVVSAVKILIEKGVPALCLASLASTCETSRGISFSILGIFLKACSSDEARTISSWRERPQITMLLNAVQRAYVLESAKLPPCGKFVIPSLPSLVSTFLAKSSLSISKPDDALYIPLNRFFLKSDVDHGAFQDMSRLPSFISLFCSGSEDPVQGRKERIWALQLIRDGFLDSSCFRLVSSCHAPELVLSSFENIRLSSFPDEMKSAEIVVSLASIKVFLDRGGGRAASHMIGKIGLLSWLRSLCTIRPISNTFPLENARVVACELIQSAVQAVSKNPFLFQPVLIDEVCGLIAPTLALCSVIKVHKRGTNLVVEPAIRTLSSICDLLHQLDVLEDFICPKTHPDGLTPDAAMDIVNHLPSGDLTKCVEAFTYLPCRLDKGPAMNSAAAALCTFLLKWSSKRSRQPSAETTKAILNRVVLIVDHYAGDFGPETNEYLTRILLSSRARYQGTEENRLLWIQCLELLSVRLRDGGMVAQLSEHVLNQT